MAIALQSVVHNSRYGFRVKTTSMIAQMLKKSQYMMKLKVLTYVRRSKVARQSSL